MIHINGEVLRWSCLSKWCLPVVFLFMKYLTSTFAATVIYHKLSRVGENVTLNCNVSVDAVVDWHYQLDFGAEEQTLFANSKYMQPGIREERLHAGLRILTLYNVSQRHSGLYTCIEDGGFGTRHFIQLVVEERVLSSIVHFVTTEAVSTTDAVSDQTDGNTVVAVTVVVVVPVIITAVAIFILRERIRHGILRKPETTNMMMLHETAECIKDSREPCAETMQISVNDFHVHLCYDVGLADKKDSEMPCELKCVSSPGTVIITDGKSLSLLSKPNVCPRCYTPAFAARECMCSITVLENLVYVICKDLPDTVIAFYLDSGHHLKDIPLKGFKEPCDIVGCIKNSILYVADLDCIGQVSLDGKVIFKFLTTSKPLSLSVTSGRLMVTTQDTLLLYGGRGAELQQLRCLSLPNMSLQHAIETERGTFIVCHLQPQPQVSEIDSDGSMIRAFGDPQQLGMPSFLSPGGEGKLFVADADKRCVLLLDANLECIGVLLDFPHNELIERPCRMCYVVHTRQLIVAGSSLFGCIQVHSGVKCLPTITSAF